MAHKSRKLPGFHYPIKFRDKGIIEYNVQECTFRGEITYYTTLLICKHGIAKQFAMNRKVVGFKTLKAAEGHLKLLLLAIARDHKQIQKDIQALPIFDGTYQTHINFKP